ncbi:hypothetical protein EB796_010162 [Bugula neritina]|uniref:Ribosomal RNA-processing protein 7 C-terminal domain-containing protein n=1 Tax=Bugula neritina TaxID=10212 RepID=A0A7J7JYP6_BUGNE|nr:hypothetical protein EB796_010162 [Bugula neritina]
MDGTVTVSGFTVIKVFHSSASNSAQYTWWLKKSNVGNGINVTGIPVYIREGNLKKIFKKFGIIEKIKIYSLDGEKEQSHLPSFQQTKGYKQADVFFVKSSAIKSVLSMKYDDKYTVLEEGSAYKPMTDVWIKDLQTSYNIPTADIASKCAKFMEAYDLRKSEEEKDARKLADEPDEDGWITVTRNKFSHPPKAVKAHELKKLRKKKENAALVHFYKNQVTDTKMQRIRELKAKFEEDKKRIQEMRQQRKFRPY